MSKLKKSIIFIFSLLLMLSWLVPPVVKASETGKAVESINSEPSVEVLSSSTGNLFEEVSSVRYGSTHEFIDGDFLISELIGENGEVLATKVDNQITGEVLTVTSATGSTIIEKTVLINGESVSEREVHSTLAPAQDDFIFDMQESVFRSLGGGWEYTGIAVGIHVFATLVDLTMAALTTTLAAIFGVPAWVVGAIFAYMGTFGLFGMQLAYALDTNGNGWIGIYKRKLNYPPYTYSHRTY